MPPISTAGEVDITNGNFVFVASKAQRIENGKLGDILKGVTIIGNGPAIMPKVSMVGNDFSLDPGVGTCGKNGQWVPVGVGQPNHQGGHHHCRRHGDINYFLGGFALGAGSDNIRSTTGNTSGALCLKYSRDFVGIHV